MAEFQSALSNLGLDSHVDWLNSVFTGTVPLAPRRAPPFGGHLIGDGKEAGTPGRIAAAFGGVPALTPTELADLRRRQAEFAQVTRAIDKQNSWLALPALAPIATVLGLEGAAATTWMLAKGLTKPPIDFPQPEPPPKIRGDNRYARAGQRAHAELNARTAQKPGWDPQVTVRNEHGVFRPDASAPARNPLDPGKRFQLELKPDTPSGRRAAARAVKRYTEKTGNKTRAIFYNPEENR
jgi:hypothetical protein